MSVARMVVHFHWKMNATMEKCISLVVVSPGVPSHNSIIQTALELGISIISELNFASRQIQDSNDCRHWNQWKSSTVWYAKQMAEQLGTECISREEFWMCPERNGS